MAYRIEFYTAGLLLLLSLLHTSQSAHITAVQQMAELGSDALKYMEIEAKSSLRDLTGSLSAGCIKEAEDHDHLNCSLISTFRSYFREAADLMKDLDKKLCNKLEAIVQSVEDLKNAKCSGNSTTCEEAFPGRKKPIKILEKLRSLLMLYLQWIVKPMQ